MILQLPSSLEILLNNALKNKKWLATGMITFNTCKWKLMLELNSPLSGNSKLCFHFCAVMLPVYEYVIIGAWCPNINRSVCTSIFTNCCGVVYSCLSSRSGLS